MISVKFENKYGVVSMGGGAHPTHKVITIDGLALPPLSRNVVSYYDEPGQELLHERVEPRTITMSMDVKNGGRAERELQRMARILKAEGQLAIKTPRRTRCIKARCTSFETGERTEAHRRLVLQFICDNPYFHDKDNTEVFCYTTGNRLKSPFTLPAVFSARTTAAAIKNIGDIKTEPIIHLYGGESNGNTTAGNIVTVDNLTTGQRLEVLYELDHGETLTIDIPNRRLYSSKAPDVNLYCISDTTFLSDFVLAEGGNNIAVAADTLRNVAVTVEYNNNYTEAIV